MSKERSGIFQNPHVHTRLGRVTLPETGAPQPPPLSGSGALPSRGVARDGPAQWGEAAHTRCLTHIQNPFADD